MTNSIHEEAVSAVNRCAEIDRRMMDELRRVNASYNAVVGWALVATFLACVLVVSALSAERHYAHQDKINQENISWQNR